jgi:hypothetical protein
MAHNSWAERADRKRTLGNNLPFPQIIISPKTISLKDAKKNKTHQMGKQ